MQSSMQLNQGFNQYFKLLKSSFNNILSTKIPKTHTHTLNKSNQFYISKTSQRQFSDHTLTHVNPVMAKSHCICTCIKCNKEYYMLCVKTSQDYISIYML